MRLVHRLNKRHVKEHSVRLALVLAFIAVPAFLPERVGSAVIAILAVYSDKIIAYIELL